jgi:hypothetical protein
MSTAKKTRERTTAAGEDRRSPQWQEKRRDLRTRLKHDGGFTNGYAADALINRAGTRWVEYALEHWLEFADTHKTRNRPGLITWIAIGKHQPSPWQRDIAQQERRLYRSPLAIKQEIRHGLQALASMATTPAAIRSRFGWVR